MCESHHSLLPNGTVPRSWLHIGELLVWGDGSVLASGKMSWRELLRTYTAGTGVVVVIVQAWRTGRSFEMSCHTRDSCHSRPFRAPPRPSTNSWAYAHSPILGVNVNMKDWPIGPCYMRPTKSRHLNHRVLDREFKCHQVRSRGLRTINYQYYAQLLSGNRFKVAIFRPPPTRVTGRDILAEKGTDKPVADSKECWILPGVRSGAGRRGREGVSMKVSLFAIMILWYFGHLLCIGVLASMVPGLSMVPRSTSSEVEVIISQACTEYDGRTERFPPITTVAPRAWPLPQKASYPEGEQDRHGPTTDFIVIITARIARHYSTPRRLFQAVKEGHLPRQT